MKKNWIYSYIALGLTWGSSFLLIEISIKDFTSVGVAFWRGLFGAMTLVSIVLFTRQKFPRNLMHWWHFAVVALLLNSLPGFLFAYGQESVSSSMAGLINGTTPIMAALIISIGFREQKLKLNQLIGILIGFFGILFISEVFYEDSSSSFLGITYLLLATFCYGIAFPYAKRYVSPMNYSLTVMASSQVLCSALILLPFAFLFGTTKNSITFSSLISILVLGILGTGFAYIWNFRNIKYAGSTIASTVTYITPIVAVLLGVIFLRENISLSQFFGGGLILLSAAIVQNRIKLFK